jgi:hypothetical protein
MPGALEENPEFDSGFFCPLLNHGTDEKISQSTSKQPHPVKGVLKDTDCKGFGLIIPVSENESGYKSQCQHNPVLIQNMPDGKSNCTENDFQGITREKIPVPVEKHGPVCKSLGDHAEQGIKNTDHQE